MDNTGTALDDDGPPDGNFTGFDHLGCKFGVDLYLTGHIHLYQRFLPALGPSSSSLLAPPRDIDHACVSEDGHRYTDPKYFPTIVVGSPGDQEITPRFACLGLDGVGKTVWDDVQAVCTADYGYGHLTVANATHMKWEFLQTGRSPGVRDHEQVRSPRSFPVPVVRDHLWLVQHNHGPRDYCDGA